MRVAGLDVGERRIGIAVSDPTGTLARPLTAIRIDDLERSGVEAVATALAELVREDDGLGRVVVGLPRRLDGTPTDLTPKVERFASALSARTGLAVVFQDERLTSREAESRLALREKDWKARKGKVDAAAAAIILQDYLDTPT